MIFKIKEIDLNNDNKIAVKIDYIDTEITISKVFEFDNTISIDDMGVEIRSSAPLQAEFDAIRTANAELTALKTKVDGLKTTFLNKEFNV